MEEKNLDAQLFMYYRKLSSFVTDEDELCTIIGYSVVGSLLDFKSNSKSDKEVKFQEVRQIYSFLDNLIESFKKTQTYDALSDLEKNILPFFEKLNLRNFYNDNESLFNSEFLNRALKDSSLSKVKNPSDYMRRIGLKIQNRISEVGILKRPIDILINDYKTIEYSFDM